MSDEDAKRIIDRISSPLDSLDDLDFALLFGSAASGQLRPFSDVDVAIHTPEPLDILRLGRLVGDVEQACGRSVDILEARGLPERNPELTERLVAMVGLRNLLVHEYDEIDENRLWRALDHVDDFRRFAAAVSRIE